MSLNRATVDRIPIWVWAAPLAAWILLGGKFSGYVSLNSTFVLCIAVTLLGAVVFAAVHHAEVIALRVGEPFGSIVLALAVTIIEVALIISIMIAAKEDSDILARDTVFATVMLVLNGIVGLCLILGGARHHEQSFQTNAATSALSVVGTLAVITLVLPNYTIAVPGPVYSRSQLLFVAAVSIVLYCVFLFVQTISHRDYFLNLSATAESGGDDHDPAPVPSTKTTLISVALLCFALGAVVLLAKLLAPSLENAVIEADLPMAFAGVIIAAVVLLPEGTAAALAAHDNRLQTSLNMALGSAMATIGLTIPVVSLVSLAIGQRLTLGLNPEQTVLLVLTLFMSTVTLATGRTTILQGSVHFVIFTIFTFLSAVP